MPAIVHSFLALWIVLIFKFLRQDKITWPHVILFSFISYLGPDFGVILWQIVNLSGGSWGKIFLIIFHNPFTFALTSLLLAFFFRYITRISFVKIDGKFVTFLDEPLLDYFQCYLLLTAGGFFHFFLDYSFHDAGYAAWFWWVIGTGYWIDPYIDGWIIIPYLCFIILFVIMILVYKKGNFQPKQEFKTVLIVTMICTLIYFIYLAIRYRLGLDPIGEEPDLGIIVYMLLFLILPLVLFTWSCFSNEEKIKSLITVLIKKIQNNENEQSIIKTSGSIVRYHLGAMKHIENYLQVDQIPAVSVQLNKLKSLL